MEFRDVVMKRRAVRRFEEGGVEPRGHRAHRPTRPAHAVGGVQPGPAAHRRDRPGPRGARSPGSAARTRCSRHFGPWVSECAAQFIPCVSEAIYHRRYQEPDKIHEDGNGDRLAGPVLVGRHRRDDAERSCWPPSTKGSAAGSSDRTIDGLRAYLGIPDEFVPIGVMPVGRPLPDVRSPSLKRGWVPFEDFARWDDWG